MSRRERFVLWTVVAAAALLRLAYGMAPRVVRWDEAGHLLVASNLAAGRGYSELAGTLDVHLPPFLPLVSAALLKLGFAPQWATASVHIVTGALLCVPIFLLGRALYGSRVGFVAAGLVAVYPALAAWPYLWSTMTESPFLLFVFGGVWAVYRAVFGQQEQHRALWYAAAGAWFGLAYLVRPEGLTYFAVLGLFMAGGTLVTWRTRAISLPRAVARLALSVAACLVVISPYVIYLHTVTGHWTLSGKVGLILDIAPAYLANDQAAHDLAVSRLDSTGTEIMWLSPDRFEKSLSNVVAADPKGFLAAVRENVRRTWRGLFADDLLSPATVVLMALGLFGQAWSRPRWKGEALLLATLLPLASFWLFFVISRFLIGALPVAMLWAAAGLDYLAEWAKTTLRGVWPTAPPALSGFVAPSIVAAALAMAVMATPNGLAAGTATMPWANVEAGHWLEANSPAGAVLMTRYSEVALYAGRPLVASPNATWEELVKYARAHAAKHLLVSESELQRLRPQYATLSDPDTAPWEVEYVRSFGKGAQALLLYRFTEQR